MTQDQFDAYLKKHLPIAWIAGVRYEAYEGNSFSTSVELDLLNQNPFGSMFWAVEGMAAEFAGGLMLLSKLEASGKSISSLVIKTEVVFSKKALGKIVFTCEQGAQIDRALETAIESGLPQLIELTSIGVDEAGDEVARFQFTWSIKVRA